MLHQVIVSNLTDWHFLLPSSLLTLAVSTIIRTSFFTLRMAECWVSQSRLFQPPKFSDVPLSFTTVAILQLHHHSFVWHCIVSVDLRWTTTESCSLLTLKQSLWLKMFNWLSGTNLTPCFDITIQDGVSKQGTDEVMYHFCIVPPYSLSLRDSRTHYLPRYLSSA